MLQDLEKIYQNLGVIDQEEFLEDLEEINRLRGINNKSADEATEKTD